MCIPDNHVKTTVKCDRFDEKTFLRYKLAEVVLLSYSCGLACKFHIHDVVVGPFDKAFLKCPAEAQVEVVTYLYMLY